MTFLPRWWRHRNQAERFDLYTRATLYAMFAAGPPLAIVGITPELGPVARWVFATYLIGQAAAGVLLLRAGLNHAQGRRGRPVRLIAGVGGLTVAGALVSLAWHSHATPGRPDGPTSLLVLVTVATYVAALSVAVPLTVSVATIGVGALAKVAVSLVEGASRHDAAAATVGFGALLLALVFTCRGSLWTLRVAWQLDRARQTEASLAVAEERLRFARDLHDVVGRSLSVVALKSELAAQLVRRGRPGAAEEMLAVRQLAEDTLTEVRAVVRGYRSVDLATELAGARSVLASAGVRCEVHGAGADLPAEVQTTLGWVVREATTNVLRHSEAATCTLELRREADRVTLVVDNDGVPQPPPPAGGAGSGLAGLAERLAVHAGTVRAEHRAPNRFRLTVTLDVR